MRTFFRVLGPLRVNSNGEDRTPSAQKLRTVLAMLLMSSNTVVASDAMVEELWASKPPASARNTLQSYIVHLRRALAQDEQVSIEHTGSGYMLVVNPAMVDVTAFTQKIAAAHQALAAGELTLARDQLTSALALFNDLPLVNVPLGPVLQASHAYLSELRLSAIEQRIAIDVELGRHHEAISELTLLVGQHPLNENLGAQLMLALYRSGRRSAALKAYHVLRRNLLNEIGLDACPAVQRMHHAVLTSDPRLDRGSSPQGTLLAIDRLTA